jgi:hypothetical protein
MTGSEGNNKRKISTPGEGYICSICSKPGHWVQQCPDKKRRKRNKNHAYSYTPGVDPSEADITRARELQKIKPPNCFCGIPSRLKKVKRSHVSDNSQAIGKYFFFCSKRKDDSTKCRFARPVEDATKAKKDIICTFFAKRGFCMRGERCMYKHEVNTENQMHATTNIKISDENSMKSDLRESATKTKDENHTNGSSKDNNSSASGSSSKESSSSSDDSSSDSDSSSEDSSSDSDSSSEDSSSDSDSSSEDSSSSDSDSK